LVTRHKVQTDKKVINQTNNDGLMGKHIVVIDDELLLVELNSLFLTSIGATVKSFT
jgi:hypothetical protein